MHEDQRSLKGIVDGVIGRICNGLGSHLLPPHFEIVIPKLVTVHVCVMELENKHKHALYDLTLSRHTKYSLNTTFQGAASMLSRISC